MYQYRGYAIQQTNSGEVHLRSPSGEFIQQFENDSEAVDYIDDLLDSESVQEVPEPEEYYVYRIVKLDKDIYNNYQYYNGKQFKYNPANIKYLTKSEAEKVRDRYAKRDDYRNYYIRNKSQR